MDAFDYNALYANGAKRSGTLMAASAREARDVLRARALTPLDLNRSRKKSIKKGDLSETQSFGGSFGQGKVCLLYTSPSPRDLSTSRMLSSA